MSGRHPRQKEGRSDTFWQFRDYAQGDPVSSIDWRQSSKLDRRLLVRQTEWEQPQTVLLWCGGGEDFDYGSGEETKRFRGLTITLALAILALRSGERVGIWGSEEPPRAGQHALPLIAEELLRQGAELPRVAPRQGALVLLVSDFHDDPQALSDAFTRIRDARGHATAIVVEDPKETDFPFQGSQRFEGPRAERRKFFGEASAVREGYLDLRQQHHAALSDAVRGPGEAVLFHRSDEPTTPLLLQVNQIFAGESR
nr:DUF58 domain-containing protein [Parvularcula mediterranea]